MMVLHIMRQKKKMLHPNIQIQRGTKHQHFGSLLPRRAEQITAEAPRTTQELEHCADAGLATGTATMRDRSR